MHALKDVAARVLPERRGAVARVMRRAAVRPDILYVICVWWEEKVDQETN